MTTEYLLNQEMEHILALLMPSNALVMRVILHTGMRVSDVLSLKTADLKPSGWYTESKTGKRGGMDCRGHCWQRLRPRRGRNGHFRAVATLGSIGPGRRSGRTLNGLRRRLDCPRTWGRIRPGKSMRWN